MKVVIPLDLENSSETAFWQKHNPEVAAMAAGAKVSAPFNLS